MGHKLIYLARRNPAVSAAAFPKAWREHSELATRFANTLGSHFRRVQQCVKIPDADVPNSLHNAHDGVAILTMKSFDDMQAARSHPRSLDEMAKDEARVFAGAVADWTMPTQEEHLFGDDTGDGQAVLLSFLACRQQIKTGDFVARLRNALEAPALRRDGLTSIALCRVLELREPPYDFAAIAEFWFRTQVEAEAALRDPTFIAALEQPEIADPERGVRMLASINYTKATSLAGGQTSWTASGD